MKLFYLFLILQILFITIAPMLAAEELPATASMNLDNQMENGCETVADNDPVMFSAVGKEWLIGEDHVNWHQAQAWIASLGNNWRAPELYELKELYCEMQQSSPIGERVVWAERHDETQAAILYFSRDFEDHGLIDSELFLVVAVRICE